MTAKTTIIASIVFLGMVLAYVVFAPGLIARADTTQLPSTVATSSLVTVAQTPLTVFATSTMCAARVVSTTGSPVMLTFSDAYTPSATAGFVQGASTTVAYDSSQYGCGKVKAYSFVTSAFTVQESR
jgi:hypothetical protein